MSGAEAAEADTEEDAEEVDQPDDEEDVPEVEIDEKADVDLDALGVDPDEVEETAGAGAESEDVDDRDESDDEQADELPAPDGETWGDQYVDMLALVLGEIAAADGEPGKTAEDIEELARAPPVELDDNVDQWLAEAGMGQNVPPGKAVAIGTAGLVLVILLTETDMATDAVDALSEQLNGDFLNF
ncbi:hypothetical protein [Haloarcula pellucida]|uniref:Uncharacterized protein n=1 Tax=Haloarcula pellucida TaxID=1427151 RepID=A0A830GR60_9EURY|nr:hypothetical protein [Halomicroarcula pellucida]MBX0348249.1 hypothetical protein [Halomicroarcula pellucida]GGN97676.1 hypothetical protein GCM10009030_27180 [Halomicroarcula pellucida]